MIASQLQEATYWLNTGREFKWGYFPLGAPRRASASTTT